MQKALSIRRVFAMLLCVWLWVACAHAEEHLFGWVVTLGADGTTTAAAMTVSSRGGVLIAGATDSQDEAAGRPYGGLDALIAYVSDTGEVIWQKRYGGGKDDRFTHVLELSDGGILAMGTTLSTDGDARNSRGGLDVFLVYMTQDGETIWVKCLGGTSDDEMLSVAETDDGRFFVCGRTKSRNGDLPSNKGGWDAWATFLSRENGRPEQRILDGHGGDDQFTLIHQTPMGWLLLGEISEEMEGAQEGELLFQIRPFALMLGDEGNEIWKVTLGGTGINRLKGIADIDAGGWILLGETNSSSIWMPTPQGGLDIWMLSLRTGGTMGWQRTYGGGRDENFVAVLPNVYGGYFFLATTNSENGHVTGTHGESDVWVASITSSGGLEWQQALGGSRASIPAGLLQTNDGGLLMAATTDSQDGDVGLHASTYTGFLSKLASNGNLEWTKLISPDEEMRLVDMQSDNGYAYVLGSVYDESGETLEERIWLGKITGVGFLKK